MIDDHRFLASLNHVLVHEGGNDDDPEDPGGRTSRGITQDDYNAYCLLHHFPLGDVWEASQQQIDQIYYDHYWLPWCPKMPPGLDYVLFDCGVLHGPSRAKKWLQRALKVVDDGYIGPQTLLALSQAKVPDVILNIGKQRRAFMKTLRGFKRFGKGWITRAREVDTVALETATPLVA